MVISCLRLMPTKLFSHAAFHQLSRPALGGSTCRSTAPTKCGCKRTAKASRRRAAQSKADGHVAANDAAQAEAADARAACPLDRVNCVFNADRPNQAQGWMSPAPSFTPETAGYLPPAGLEWHSDVSYADLPFRAVTCPWRDPLRIVRSKDDV